DPQLSRMTTAIRAGCSWFHSMQTSVETRLSEALTFHAAWTYSKYMTANTYKNDTDLRPERVISPDDYPHRFVLSGIYELPFGKGRHFLSGKSAWVDGFLGGWQFEGYYEAQSGLALGFGDAIFRGDIHNVPLP